MLENLVGVIGYANRGKEGFVPLKIIDVRQNGRILELDQPPKRPNSPSTEFERKAFFEICDTYPEQSWIGPFLIDSMMERAVLPAGHIRIPDSMGFNNNGEITKIFEFKSKPNQVRQLLDKIYGFHGLIRAQNRNPAVLDLPFDTILHNSNFPETIKFPQRLEEITIGFVLSYQPDQETLEKLQQAWPFSPIEILVVEKPEKEPNKQPPSDKVLFQAA